MSFYATITGDGEDLSGGCRQSNYEGWIDVLEYRMPSVNQTEKGMSTGRATGRRAHGPFKIKKPVDVASPKLFKAFCNNQVITMKLNVHIVNPESGQNEHAYTWEITNGRIRGIEQEVRRSTADVVGEITEWISFYAEEWTQTWEDGGVTHTDNFLGEV